MANIRSELMPDHKVYELADGFKVGAHKHSCLFCFHCTDIFWDCTNGIYNIICDRKWDNDSMIEHINLAFSGKCQSFEECVESEVLS